MGLSERASQVVAHSVVGSEVAVDSYPACLRLLLIEAVSCEWEAGQWALVLKCVGLEDRSQKLIV